MLVYESNIFIFLLPLPFLPLQEQSKFLHFSKVKVRIFYK